MSDSSTNSGGPAFPTGNERQTGPVSWHYEGMTLCDWFAGQALQGELASTSSGESARAIAEQSVENGCSPEAQLAMNAYDMAEAMIAERERRGLA